MNFAFLFVLALLASAAARASIFTNQSKLYGSTDQNTSFGILDDMLFADGQLEQGKAFVTPVVLWPDGKIFYEIDASVAASTSLIEQAMSHIMSKTENCVTFVRRTHELNYVTILKGIGCMSFLGMAGVPQAVILGEECHNLGTIIHELLHAVGFYHEQCRNDRDNYVTIHWENIELGQEINYLRVPGSDFFQYDYDSIMHYGGMRFSKNGKPTIMRKDSDVPFVEVRDKTTMTERDIQGVKILYNC